MHFSLYFFLLNHFHLLRQFSFWRLFRLGSGGGGRLPGSEVKEEEGADLKSHTKSDGHVWAEQSGELGPGSMGGGEIMAAPCLGKLRL